MYIPLGADSRILFIYLFTFLLIYFQDLCLKILKTLSSPQEFPTCFVMSITFVGSIKLIIVLEMAWGTYFLISPTVLTFFLQRPDTEKDW